jgi:tetratricopeptide (TPR) repeat protein
MSLGSDRVPLPKDSERFQLMCLAVLRVTLEAPGLRQYGRSGQKQKGIDLYGQTKEGLLGVQCKLRNRKKLKFSEIEGDIEKAKEFLPKLRMLLIATTAARDAALQEQLAQLSDQHLRAGLFAIEPVFWEDIEDAINQNSKLRQEITQPDWGPHLESAFVPMLKNALDALGLGSLTALDDEIKTILESHQNDPASALTLLQDLRKRRQETLEATDRSTLATQIGLLQLKTGNPMEAANSFVDAGEFTPDSPEATALRAAGLSMRGDDDAAFVLAEDVCLEHPSIARAHAVRIRTDATSSLTELQASVPPDVADDPEVLSALADRAEEAGQLELAAEHTRKVVAYAPDWIDGKLNLAVLLLRMGAGELWAAGKILGQDARSLVEEAASILNEIDEQLASADPGRWRALVQHNLANAKEALGDSVGAESARAQAFALAQGIDEIACGYAQALNRRGDSDGAIRILQTRVDACGTLAVRHCLANVLIDRAAEGDLERSVSILYDGLPAIAGLRSSLLQYVYYSALCGAIELTGREVDSKLPNGLTKCLELQMYILLDKGEATIKQLADDTFALALAATGDDVFKSECARILRGLSRADDAISLWKQVDVTQVNVEVVKDGIRAAMAGEDEVWALDACRAIRESGQLNRDLLEYEFSRLFDVGEFDQAEAVLADLLAVIPTDSWALANRCLLGFKAKRPEWIDPDFVAKHPASEVDSDLGRVATLVLMHSDRAAALDYGYELYRRHPDDEGAHFALIQAVFNPDFPPLRIPKVESIQMGVAVRVETDEGARVYFLEDGKDPSPAAGRNEFAADHPITMALLGCKVGDAVSIPGSKPPLKGIVERIADCRLGRANQCMEEWTTRFPNHNFIQRVKMPGPREGMSAEEALGPLMEVLEGDEQRRREFEALYNRGNASLANIASAVGATVLEVMGEYASNPKLVVRAANGSDYEKAVARDVVSSGGILVIDGSALATLSMLGQVESLKEWPCPVIASQALFEELGILKSKYSKVGGASFLGMRDGKPVFTELSPDAAKAAFDRVDGIERAIKSIAEFRGGKALLSLPERLSDVLSKILPASTAQTVGIGADPRLTVLTDDVWIGNVVRLVGGRATSTGALLFELAQRGNVEADTFADGILSMLRWRYRVIGVSSDVIVRACEIDEWKVGDNVEAVLEHLRDPVVRGSSLVGVVASALAKLWRKAPLQESATVLTSTIVEALLKRPDRGQCVIAIYRLIDPAFGLNVIQAPVAKQVIEATATGRLR